MHPLLITMTFLMLMGIITTTSVKTYMDSSHESAIYEEYLQSETQRVKERAALRLQKIKEEVPKEKRKKELEIERPPKKISDKPLAPRKKSIKLGFQLHRPPNNSRLNFYLLLRDKDNKEAPILHYEIAAALVRQLYGDKPFFMEISRLEYKILDTLLAQKNLTTTFVAPDQLSSIIFDDEKVQEAFYQMLSEEPSLLDYITFDKETRSPKTKINLMFAPPELLQAIFSDRPHICAQLLAARGVLWERILSEEEHRKELNADFCLKRGEISKQMQEEFIRIVGNDAHTILFDFTLGHPGSVLFIPTAEDKTLRKRLF